MDSIVEIRNVTKRYGAYVAVENFSLAIARGEFLTLLGPSGSGKTTILRLIAGFELPQSGEIFLEGRDASALPPYRRNVNTVFQHYALFPHLDVFHNVAFGLEQKKLAPDEIRLRVRAMLELVELPGKEERYPRELSGGEQQRVALARALVLEPSVLLLDEPLGALDEKLRKQMQLELKRLRERLGITFVFVTHDQQEALIMSDRVAVIQRGRLEQISPGEEVYERPATRFVAEFMGVENFFDATSAGRKDGCAEFETSTGVRLRASGNFAQTDGPATIAVRPESVSISSQPPASGQRNALQGVVVETVYEGGRRRWSVKLATGERVVVRESGSAAAADVRAPGAKVYLHWPAEKSLVYPRGEFSSSK
jgi:spermidine/putrescine transport system ATP-binding protein